MTLLTNVSVDGDVPTRSCAWCDQRFYQGSKRQRFCSLECGVEFFKAERRAALVLFRSLAKIKPDEEIGDERRTGTG